ncbi:MAG TPA: endolytic transglycosylase MltG [Cytophagaceae bacterium]
MNNKNKKLRVFIVVLILLFVSFSYYGYQIFFTPNFNTQKNNAGENPDRYLLIPTGATFQTVLDSLEKNKLIEDKLSFAFLAKLSGYQDNVKAGRYLIENNDTNLTLLKRLKNGQQTPVKLTFNSIRLKKDFIERISHRFEFSKEELDSLLNTPAFVSKFGLDTTTVMTLFLPNTYEIFWNISAEDFVERMQYEHNVFWTDERKAKAQAAGLTPVQVSILASIVEAETNKKSEKARIAGLYLNRIRIGMPLQADPTVKFAVGDFTLKRIYKGHIETDSPYNTYKYAGLPPGPINLPSLESIEAVLNHEKHKYIYFCASHELNGYHNFAETYEAHQKNAERYRKALNKLNIR